MSAAENKDVIARIYAAMERGDTSRLSAHVHPDYVWRIAGQCSWSRAFEGREAYIMKSLSVADRHGWTRYVAHQVYYSLLGRDYEWELMPLATDQGIGAMVWSPLGWGRLTGKVRRGQPLPTGTRLHETASFVLPSRTNTPTVSSMHFRLSRKRQVRLYRR